MNVGQRQCHQELLVSVCYIRHTPVNLLKLKPAANAVITIIIIIIIIIIILFVRLSNCPFVRCVRSLELIAS